MENKSADNPKVSDRKVSGSDNDGNAEPISESEKKGGLFFAIKEGMHGKVNLNLILTLVALAVNFTPQIFHFQLPVIVLPAATGIVLILYTAWQARMGARSPLHLYLTSGVLIFVILCLAGFWLVREREDKAAATNALMAPIVPQRSLAPQGEHPGVEKTHNEPASRPPLTGTRISPSQIATPGEPLNFRVRGTRILPAQIAPGDQAFKRRMDTDSRLAETKGSEQRAGDAPETPPRIQTDPTHELIETSIKDFRACMNFGRANHAERLKVQQQEKDYAAEHVAHGVTGETANQLEGFNHQRNEKRLEDDAQTIYNQVYKAEFLTVRSRLAMEVPLAVNRYVNYDTLVFGNESPICNDLRSLIDAYLEKLIAENQITKAEHQSYDTLANTP